MPNLIRMRFETFEECRSALSELHDHLFELDRAGFDQAAATWHGWFIRPLDDPTRVVRQRTYLVLVTHYYPVVETRVTLEGVKAVTVRDRAEIGTYTFNDLHRTDTGCRLVFNEDLEINVQFAGDLRGEFRDERELPNHRGYITSLGPIDFGFRVEQPNQRLERTGGQPSYLMRAPEAAGRSTAGRYAA